MSIQVSKAVPPTTVSIGEKPAEVAPQEAAPVETPTTPESVPAPPKDERMVELERKERAIRAQAKQLAQEKAALEAQKASLAPANKPGAMTAEEWKAQFLQDPTKLGISLDEMASKYLSQPSEEAQKIARLEAKLAEMEQATVKSREEMTAAQQQAYDNALKQIETDARRLIESKPQEFEAISAEGAHKAVVDLIERTYKEENILMSVEEAAQEVENYLLERAVKLAGLTKVRAKTATPAPSQEAPVTKTPNQQQTLTRAISSTQGLSRIERAKLAFQGKLNS